MLLINRRTGKCSYLVLPQYISNVERNDRSGIESMTEKVQKGPLGGWALPGA